MLKLRLITLTFDPETASFPEDPLRDIPGEIVSVVEHFFYFDGLPRVLLLVQHRPPVERAKRARVVKEDATHALSPPESQLFERLRVWRRGRAEADGVPPYVVLNNRELAEIVRRRPTNLAALGEVSGIGENKTRRYGRDILQIMKDFAGLSGSSDHATPQEDDSKNEP